MKKFLSVLFSLLFSLFGFYPASADYMNQSKTFNLGGNQTWAFNDDCSKGLALWPRDLLPSNEWMILQPGSAVFFDIAPINVNLNESPNCEAIQAQGGAGGTQVGSGQVFIDANGDGSYELLNPVSQFSTPTLGERVAPYRISAYWEYAPGQRIVNEYWIYVGNVSGISINQGAQFSTDQNVRLNITPMPGTETMQISNDAGFSEALNFPALNTVDWKLSQGIDIKVSKTVYCRFFNRDGGLLGTLSDDIILDAYAPTLTKTSVAKSSGADSLVLSKSKLAKKYKLTLSASDAVSGLSNLQISTQANEITAKTIVFKKTLKVSAIPSKKIYIRIQDLAGNWSKWRSITVPK